MILKFGCSLLFGVNQILGIIAAHSVVNVEVLCAVLAKTVVELFHVTLHFYFINKLFLFLN